MLEQKSQRLRDKSSNCLQMIFRFANGRAPTPQRRNSRAAPPVQIVPGAAPMNREEEGARVEVDRRPALTNREQAGETLEIDQ
jgi:hypothetical protein